MSRKSFSVLPLLLSAFIGFSFAGPAFSQSGDGWVTLIDGEFGLDNWIRVANANWQGIDGSIQADSKTGEANGFLLSKESYGDFQLRVEFWASDDANSGIFLRCSNPDEITDKTCYEANIFDQRPDPTYGTGAIVNISPITDMPKAGGQWNTYEITAQGPHLVLMFNGTQTADVNDDKFASGPIGLQYASGVIKFRKVQIKPL
jgi:hypothetical protein